MTISRRYRWRLSIVCLAAVAVGWLCWPRAAGQFTREQYDRIRFGMTPADVASVMGCAATNGHPHLSSWLNQSGWDYEANDNAVDLFSPQDQDEIWVDDGTMVTVIYRHGRVCGKGIEKRAGIVSKTRKAVAREVLKRF